MIDYLIKSGLCLVILLAVYHLFLEKEKMHRFNRFFLLFSLGFGLLVPLMSLGLASSPLQPIGFSNMEGVAQSVIISGNTNPDMFMDTSKDYASTIILAIYGLGVLLLLTRFIINLVKITVKIKGHPGIKSGHSVLVLLEEEVVPHSFLNYIFLNENAYLKKEIEEQIVTHELTHVRQKHSIDILIAEILRIIFWFNPVFIFYKNAILLNHEFLADESVVVTYRDVPGYQSLLLETAGLKTISLANTLNYSLTKKRLKMMTKRTSGLKILTAKLAVIALLGVMMFLFSTKATSTVPQLKSKAFKTIVAEQYPENPDKETYYKDATIWMKSKEGKFEPRKYNDMTATEKDALPPVPSLTVPGHKVTKEMLADWTTRPSVYGVWLDSKRIKNSDLANYKPGDFAYYYNSKLTKTATNYGKHYFQISLCTPKNYEEFYVKPRSQPGKSLLVYEGKIRNPLSLPLKELIANDELRKNFHIELIVNDELRKNFHIRISK